MTVAWPGIPPALPQRTTGKTQDCYSNSHASGQPRPACVRCMPARVWRERADRPGVAGVGAAAALRPLHVGRDAATEVRVNAVDRAGESGQMDQLQSIRAFVTVAGRRLSPGGDPAARVDGDGEPAGRCARDASWRTPASTQHLPPVADRNRRAVPRARRADSGAIDEIDGRVVAMGSKPEGALRIAAPVAFGSAS